MYSVVLSSPPPSPRSHSPSASLLSLPIEIFHDIIYSIPEVKDRQRPRRAALVNVSLVNRFLCQIARPLLYERVPFDLVRYDAKRGYSQQLMSLIKTFEEKSELIGFVKHVEISLGLDMSDWTRFTRFLPEMEQLQAISVHDIGNWFTNGKTSHLSDFFIRLAIERLNIRTIEVTKRLLDTFDYTIIILSFPQLECLIASFNLKFLGPKRLAPHGVTIDASYVLKVPHKLQRIVLRAPIDHRTFNLSIATSCDSLTSVSLVISYEPLLVDLANLSNLEYLHLDLCLKLGDFPYFLDKYPLVIDHSEYLLLSAQTLSIKTLKITTSTPPTLYLPPSERLPAAIPTSIQNLLLQSRFLTQGQWLSILPLTGHRRLHQLKHVGVYPPHEPPFSFVTMPESPFEEVQDFAPTCERFGISCEFF